MSKSVFIGKVTEGKNVGWPKATEKNGKMIAQNPNLKQLEISLDKMFQYDWVGIMEPGFAQEVKLGI